MLEPRALASVAPKLDIQSLEATRARVDAALERPTGLSTVALGAIETELHIDLLKPLRNRRLSRAVKQSQISLVINRLFGRYIGFHDETALLGEHRLVFDHLLLQDAEGAAVALRYHLDADHQRSRARLKVLSVFDTPDVAPYLTRIH